MRLPLATVIIALLCSGAQALTIDDQTPCTLAAQAFDTENIPEVREVALYVHNVLEKLDAIHTENGEPGIMANLSDDGVQGIIAVTVSFCRQHPRATIYNEAGQAYRGVRDMELQFGTAK